MSSQPPEEPARDDDRLMRLEESAAFTERSLEELTQQMLDLDARVRALTRRLNVLASGIERLSQRGGDPPAPDAPAEPAP